MNQLHLKMEILIPANLDGNDKLKWKKFVKNFRMTTFKKRNNRYTKMYGLDCLAFNNKTKQYEDCSFVFTARNLKHLFGKYLILIKPEMMNDILTDQDLSSFIKENNLCNSVSFKEYTLNIETLILIFKYGQFSIQEKLHTKKLDS